MNYGVAYWNCELNWEKERKWDLQSAVTHVWEIDKSNKAWEIEHYYSKCSCLYDNVSSFSRSFSSLCSQPLFYLDLFSCEIKGSIRTWRAFECERTLSEKITEIEGVRVEILHFFMGVFQVFTMVWLRALYFFKD